ncbi:MAG: class I SAM-dependent methyltransferase [Nannocystaceae bacterium]|nr:class I SAM-dependent methyltransferase [bacterium]
MKRSTNAPPRSIEIVPADPRPRQSAPRRDRLTDLVDRMTADVVLSHVPGQRVLDLGRGIRQLAEWVEERAASLSVVDASDLGRGADVHLALPDEQFDLIYCVRTLPHLGRDDETSISAARSLLAETARVLRDDGTALIGFDNPRSVWGLYLGLRNPTTVVEGGPLVVDSDRGLTRLDTLGRFKRMLPRSLHLARLHGIRIAVHAPSLLAIPVLGSLAERFEWFARDRRLLSTFGAHMLVELRKVGTTSAS